MKLSSLRAFLLCFSVIPILLIAMYVVQQVGAHQPPPPKVVAAATAPATPTPTPAPPSPAAGNRYPQLGTGACEISALTGFHDPENWGVWSSQERSVIALNNQVSGTLHVQFIGYVANALPNRLNITIGEVTKSVILEKSPKPFDLTYALPHPAKEIVLSGITPKRLPQDSRLLAVGLVRINCTK